MSKLPTFTLADATRKEREFRRRRRNGIIGVAIAAVLITGNLALFLYREQVIGWVRTNLGHYEIVVEKNAPN